MTDDLVKRLRQKQFKVVTENGYTEIGYRWGPLFDEAADRIEQLQSSLANAYADCLECVAGIKQDSFTEIAEIFKIDHSSTLTAKDFMVAIAEDIEKAIKVRAALAGEKKDDTTAFS